MFDEEQKKYIKSLGLNVMFDSLSDDDLFQIEEVVAEKLEQSGFDEHYNRTAIGEMCESILDELP